MMVAHRDTKGELVTYKVTAEQWENAQSICSFLEKPAQISTLMGSEKYVTISKALLAKRLLLKHCNENVDNTNELVAKASELILDNVHYHLIS